MECWFNLNEIQSRFVGVRYLTLPEAALYLNSSESTIREWIRMKGLPYHKPGKQLLFRPKDLDLWMNRYQHGDRGLAMQRFNRD